MENTKKIERKHLENNFKTLVQKYESLDQRIADLQNEIDKMSKVLPDNKGDYLSKEAYLTPTQLAHLLGVKNRAVYQMIRRKEIPILRIGRLIRISPKFVDSLYKESCKNISKKLRER